MKAPRVGGLVEIARLLGKHPQTVKGWKARGLLPEPIGTVSGAPAYDLDEVERWYRKSPPTAGRPQK